MKRNVLCVILRSSGWLRFASNHTIPALFLRIGDNKQSQSLATPNDLNSRPPDAAGKCHRGAPWPPVAAPSGIQNDGGHAVSVTLS